MASCLTALTSDSVSFKIINDILVYFRVVAQGDCKEINGHTFTGFGSHFDRYPYTYLTAAAAIGMTKTDVDLFVKRLNETFSKWKKKIAKVTPQTQSCDTESVDLGNLNINS